jgi:hypothetical protein
MDSQWEEEEIKTRNKLYSTFTEKKLRNFYPINYFELNLKLREKNLLMKKKLNILYLSSSSW